MKRIRLLLLLTLLAAAGTWAQTTHSVKMKSGTKDAENWTIATGSGESLRSVKGDATEGLTGLAKGDEVRLKYTGKRHVKSITAVLENLTIDLSDIPASALVTEGSTTKLIVPDGTTLTGTLDGANILNYKWAGLTCTGTATIILKDGTTNVMKGFYNGYPGIFVPSGSKLTSRADPMAMAHSRPAATTLAAASEEEIILSVAKSKSRAASSRLMAVAVVPVSVAAWVKLG